MQKREINPTTKEQAKKYAKIVLEKKLNCAVDKISYVGGGSFGYVYKADINKPPNKVIIKACRTDGMCIREKDELTLLGQDSIIKVPKVYFAYYKNGEIPLDFICMELVDGKDTFSDFTKIFKSKSKKREFADKITTAMNVWHSKTNNKFGFISDPQYDEWLDFYKPFAEDILNTARELCKKKELEKFVLSTMEKAWDEFDYIFSERVTAPSLIHGDLNVANIMTDSNLNPTAIIDPLESKWADKEYELFQLRNLSGEFFGLYKMYKSKYEVSEKCDIKTAFYALYHEIYCYIISGMKFKMILYPLAARMNKELKKAGL